MNESQLRDAIMRQPSLMQYSIESSLRPKIQFLVNELSICPSAIAKIITTAPAIMGLSLAENLRPKVAVLMNQCDLSSKAVGIIVATSPPILTLSQKRKIEPCLSFLSSALNISDKKELGQIVQTVPRVLVQSVDTSLAPKLLMLEEALEEEMETQLRLVGSSFTEWENITAAEIMKRNPSLLVTSNEVFKNRIRAYLNDPRSSLSSAFQPGRKGRKRSYNINLISEQEGDVHSSQSQTTQNSIEVSFSRKETLVKAGCSKNDYADFNDMTRTNNRISDITANQPLHIFDGTSLEESNDLPREVLIVAHVSGKVFPTDDSNIVRGTRRAGGLAIHFPQINMGNEELVRRLQLASDSSFGVIMSEAEGGSKFRDGLVMSGFPFLRPSRNRCDLYACHSALKLILHFLRQAAMTINMKNVAVKIEICTNSAYAWKLLHDSDRVARWGEYSFLEEFKFDGKGPSSLANPDLLFPLCKTFDRLVKKDLDDGEDCYKNPKICIGKSVDIRFIHSADATYLRNLDYPVSKVDQLAKEAAMWQFCRAKNAAIK